MGQDIVTDLPNQQSTSEAKLAQPKTVVDLLCVLEKESKLVCFTKFCDRRIFMG